MRHCREEMAAVVLQVQTVRGGAGTCTRCGRPLRDPVSVQLGMGPVCAGRLAADAANQAAENGVIITVDGRPLIEWAEQLGISPSTLRARLVQYG